MRFSVFAANAVLFIAVRAQAQVAPSPNPPSGAAAVGDAAAAHQHFERALAWYRNGRYRLAVEELGAALARDPGGKDLVFNLALVQEKLGDLSGAIGSLQRFQSLERDPAELERAAHTIQRLEGARADIIADEAQHGAVPPSCPAPHERGKLDGWVLGTGGVALASFVIGSVFAVRALTLAPRAEAASAAADRADRAHSAEVAADIALSASLLAGVGSAALYFGRYAAPSTAYSRPLPALRATAAWLEIRF